jgi:hypothetical protein
MTNVVEIFAETGETVQRDFTPAELEQRKVDQDEHEANVIMAKQIFSERAVAREAAIAHAKSLGFTDEMIAVMYPTLMEA